MVTTDTHVRRDRRNRPIFLQNIIIIRLINAWWISTFFQPDEFFQSLEPAWRLAFGAESGAWLTWEWHHQLRSSLHPVIFSGGYIVADWIAKVLPPGNTLRAAIVVGSPKVLQALSAGLCDWYTWQLAVKIFGPDSNNSFFALFLQLFNPWQWYCATRSFSNSLETTLTVMALYYWPWRVFIAATPIKENPRPTNVIGSAWRLRASLCLAALAVILRPTNALIWATMAFVAISRLFLQGDSPLTWSSTLLLVREAVSCGSIILAISTISDRWYFGFWTFPPYNWLHFNISRSLAVFYGRNPWHYYLSQGIPLLCTTSLPFALLGVVRPAASSANEANVLRTLSTTVLTTTLSLSLISHKEVRFLYPLLPILSILAAPHAASFFTHPPPTTTTHRPRIRNKTFLLAGLLINLILASYLSFLHQPAPLTVLSFLRREYERIHPSSVRLAHTHRAPSPPDELFALFLMPCHSTPWRSRLYYPGLRARALTCEPPLHTHPGTPERETYRDEADRFYDDPLNFLDTELFVPHASIPRYIVGFEGVEPWLREFLDSPSGRDLGITLQPVWSGFNGFFNEDWRRSGRMLVWDTGVYGRGPDGGETGKAELG